MRNYLFIIFIFCFLLHYPVLTQEVGSFEKIIKFKGFDRTLSIHVPEEYDSKNKYQLFICLHANNDNSKDYRDKLIDYYRWNQFIEQTIFVFPDGGDDTDKDFYKPLGDEGIIDRSISFAKQFYNIDTAKIFLQGFMEGGRSALKYTLDYPGKFFGLLLNTPSFQGLEDVKNNQDYSLIYNFQNSSKINTSIVYGDKDYLQRNSIKAMYDSLVENNAKVQIKVGAGIGIENAIELYLTDALQFLNNLMINEYEYQIYKIEYPHQVCDSLITLKFKVRNIGKKSIDSILISYFSSTDNNEFLWVGELLPFHVVDIVIPYIKVEEEGTFFSYHSGLENGHMVIYYYKTGKTQPIVESIEKYNFKTGSFWKINEDNNYPGWLLDTTVGKDGKFSLMTYNSTFLPYNKGSNLEIISPIIDLSGTEYFPTLKFDIAFNYHQFEPPTTPAIITYSDTLEVLISTDCGENFISMYRKTGEELKTFSVPIINPSNIDNGIFVPKPDDWRNEVISLKEYSQYQNVLVKFKYISGQGGTFYLDNLIVGDVNLSKKETELNKFQITPNPASENILLNLKELNDDFVNIKIINATGKNILSLENIDLALEKTKKININDLPTGLYFLIIQGQTVIKTEKFIKI